MNKRNVCGKIKSIASAKQTLQGTRAHRQKLYVTRIILLIIKTKKKYEGIEGKQRKVKIKIDYNAVNEGNHFVTGNQRNISN